MYLVSYIVYFLIYILVHILLDIIRNETKSAVRWKTSNKTNFVWDDNCGTSYCFLQ